MPKGLLDFGNDFGDAFGSFDSPDCGMPGSGRSSKRDGGLFGGGMKMPSMGDFGNLSGSMPDLDGGRSSKRGRDVRLGDFRLD